MRREKKRKEIYHKLRTKYEFHRKYKEANRQLRERGDVPALREEMRKNDEEFLAFMERLNSIEGGVEENGGGGSR